VTAAVLVWVRDTAPARRAGLRYVLVHLTGGAVLLVGLVAHVGTTGRIAFEHFEPSAAAWLILIGFCLNAAVPPLGAWLPDAYPKASVTGAVLMSALTTKSAVYALLRGFAGWEVLVAAGVFMALYGVVYAVLANDIRELLAYHIISQVGYMVAGCGLGTAMAVNGAVAHAVCHILYKSLLFMGAGVVITTTGRSKLTELGGFVGRQRLVFGLYMIGAFSISGFPLFNGFVSKSVIVSAAAEGGCPASELLLTLASVGTFLHTGLKLPYFTFFGPDRGIEAAPLPRNMIVGMGLAAALCIGLGVFPGWLYARLPFLPFEYHP
jgi:multicomponent Na+:H+ antiporter subunit D